MMRIVDNCKAKCSTLRLPFSQIILLCQVAQNTCHGSTTWFTTMPGGWALNQMHWHIVKMSTPKVRMLMHLITCITPSPCPWLASYCEQSSWTQCPSSSPCIMASILTQSPSHIWYACKSALTWPPWSLLLFHLLTCGHSQKMATSFTIRDYCIFLTIKTC